MKPKYKKYEKEGFRAYSGSKNEWRNPYRHGGVGQTLLDLKKAFYWYKGFCRAERKIYGKQKEKKWKTSCLNR